MQWGGYSEIVKNRFEEGIKANDEVCINHKKRRNDNKVGKG